MKKSKLRKLNKNWYIPKIFRTYYQARKVFIKPKIAIYIGKWSTGLPMYKPKEFIRVYHYDLIWKDKFNSPRHEYNPAFNIIFFKGKYQILIWLKNPITNCDEEYWEQMLWFLYYYKQYNTNSPNITQAREKWLWKDQYGKSTWKDDFIKPNKVY
jgi:hypothetical protein